MATPQTARADDAANVQAAKATALLKKAEALEAAGKLNDAAATYGKAGDAFTAAGDNEHAATAMEKSAAVYERIANALLNTPSAAPAHQLNVNTTPAEVPKVPPPLIRTPGAQGPTGGMPLPLPGATIPPAAAVTAPAPVVPAEPIDASPLVNKNAAGEPAVMEKSGKPVDGVPLSKHNSEIFSPSIAVGRDGTIHVAFCEKQAVTPYAYFVYYRSSSDGGKTWSEAKNLSEDLPDTGISRCQVLVDASNRAYVIWRSDFAPGRWRRL